MRLPTGGGNTQSISGRVTVGIDTSQLKRDGAAAAGIAKQSAERISQAFSATGAQASMGLQPLTRGLAAQRRQMEQTAKAAITFERQKQKALKETEKELAKQIPAQTRLSQVYKVTNAQAAMGLRPLSLGLAEQRRQMEETAKAALKFEWQKQKAFKETERALARRAKAQNTASPMFMPTGAQSAMGLQPLTQGLAKQRQEWERNAKAAISLEKQKQKALKETERELERQRKAQISLSESIERAQWTLTGFAVAGAAVAAVGIRAADSARLLTVQYEQLAGSAGAGARLMTRVENAVREMNAPVRQSQRDFLGLIPAVQASGENLEDYINLALRLQTLNPTQGLEGSVFAIREALVSGGTDLVSLSERFNIPRKMLRELTEQTGSFSAALDIVLNRYGATTEAAQANSRSISVLTAQIRDTVNRVLEKTFAGALELVSKGLQTFNDLLENTPQWLIDVGAYSVVLTGALAALALAGNTVYSSFARGLVLLRNFGQFLSRDMVNGARQAATELKKLAATQTGKRVIGGGLAIAGGIAAGIGVTNFIGRATGNEELANANLDTLLEHVKKILYTGIGLLIEFIEKFVVAGSHIVTIIQTFGDQLKMLGLRFQIMFAEMGLAIQRSLGTFGNQDEIKRLEALLNGTVRSGGGFGGETSEGSIGGGGLRGDLTRLENDVANRMVENEEAVASTFDNIQKALYDTFFPVPEQVEAIGESFDNLFMGVGAALAGLQQQQGDALAATADNTIALYQELSELIEEGSVDSLEGRLRGLEREKEAIEALLPDLIAASEHSEAAAEKLAEYRKRLEEISSTLPQFMDALVAVTQRGIAEAMEEYTEAMEKAEADHAKALEKINEKEREAEADLAEDGAEKLQDIRDKIAEIEADYQQSILKAEENFRKRMEDIQRNYFRAVTLAASMLDAAGVAAAILERNDQTREANEERNDAIRAAAEKRNEALAAAAQELLDLQAFLAERRQEIINDYALQRAEVEKALYEQRQALMDTLSAETTAIHDYYTRRYNDLVAFQEAERALRLKQQMQLLADIANATVGTFMRDFGTRLGFGQGGAADNVASFLTGAGRQVLGNVVASGSGGLAGIGQVMFNIYDATDPNKVAAVVNDHLVALAES
jgi:hypothetical protein